jgi:hypothetical protein
MRGRGCQRLAAAKQEAGIPSKAAIRKRKLQTFLGNRKRVRETPKSKETVPHRVLLFIVSPLLRENPASTLQAEVLKPPKGVDLSCPSVRCEYPGRMGPLEGEGFGGKGRSPFPFGGRF